MAYVLIFCTANEARPLMPKLIHSLTVEQELVHNPLAIVKSLELPQTKEFDKTPVKNGDFESDFIGKSIDELREWFRQDGGALYKDNAVRPFFAVLDEGSIEYSKKGKDTVLIQYYHEESEPLSEEEDFDIEGGEVVREEDDAKAGDADPTSGEATQDDAEEEGTADQDDEELPAGWYSLRIHFKDFNQVWAALEGITSPEVVFPYYFQERCLTDGVFDSEKHLKALGPE